MLGGRSQSLSKLRPFVSSISSLSRSPLASSPQALIPSHSFPQNPKSPPKPFSLFSLSFSSKPTGKELSFSREGNYADEEEEEEPTSQAPTATKTAPFHVCPGCGVHMQSSDPKSPGFFLEPSSKKALRLSAARLQPGPLEPEFSDSLKRGLVIEPEKHPTGPAEPKPMVCARCHSLRHYGRVKDSAAENLLPDFDFDGMLGPKITASRGARSVVLAVVDSADFDGSFPRRVAKAVSRAAEENSAAWKQGRPGNVPRLVLVATKIDLLGPAAASPTRLEHWVRQRAREGGAHGRLSRVHLVSASRGWGVSNLVDDVAAMAGPRGRVWVVGAQNAGKSTLINSMAKWCCGDEEREGKASYLTEAAVPGTTLGIVRVEGVLPGQAKLFDTPGLLHPHQITTRLTRDEQRLVNISKELKPRTYRIKAGHSVHIAGLMRLDVEELSVDSIYVTVWASVYLPLHMGKTENAREMMDEHFGRQLQPPIGHDRVKKLGQWVRKEFRVSGNSWDSSSVDIAAAGLGWFAIGLKGDAVLSVWTYDGIDIVLRNALIPNRARMFEVAGFSVSKIVAKADQALNKSLSQSEKRKLNDDSKEASQTETSLLSTDEESLSC